ncbi:MAG: cysteine-rich repeat protein [Hyphomicrobiaceae bacterium]|jgi:cysteine-rich repeat protein
MVGLLAIIGSAAPSAAQTSQSHTIPPFYARADLGAQIVLVTTLETTPFDVLLRDGAGTLLHTFVDVSRANPDSFDLPLGGTSQVGILDETELNLVSTEGLTLTGVSPFTANVRHKTSEQGFSLTSKGGFGLGTDFRTGHLISNTEVANSKAHFVAVMATEDGTMVTFGDIDPSLTFFGDTANPFSTSATLDAGESYVIAYLFDDPTSNETEDPNLVNGLHVTSTKPIAVNTGSWLGGNAEGNRKDMGIDQTVPTERTGTEFVVIKGDATTRADVLERPSVVAITDRTQVFAATTLVATLDAGEHHFIAESHYSAAGNMFISTSNPAYLYQSTSGNDANGNGLSVIPPLRCNGDREAVIAETDLLGTSDLGIVARAGASVSVAGVTLTGGGDAVFGTNAWVTYRVPVTGDVEVISSNVINVSLVTAQGNRGAAGFFTGFADAPAVSIVGPTDLCDSNTILLDAAAAFNVVSFQWYFNGVAILGATSSTYLADAAGSYTVEGVLLNDGSDTCGGGQTSLSPPVVLSLDNCFCGDGTTDAYESCDDGNTISGDGCDANCDPESCGDNIVNNSTETCDDGNTANGDGCNASCILEVCGDGTNNNNGVEQCDDGGTAPDDGCGPTCLTEFCGDNIDNNGTEECDDGGTVSGDGCSATCVIEVCGDNTVNNNGVEQCDDGGTAADDGCGPTCLTEFCGDNIDNNGTEECDDGGTVSGDGCSATCEIEICGDNTVNNNGVEECDDGNVNSGDGCNASCLNEFCGDNVTNNNGVEECDDGNTTAGDGCGATCLNEFCGDGTTNGSEECDDGNGNSGDGCSASCLNEFCGDNVTNNNGVEECDDGNTAAGDGCGATCLNEFCGDGTTNGSEECDDGNTTAGDGCGATCSNEFCGDNVVNNNSVEECDDGNTADDDGCSASCINEVCGDGVDNNGTETCDDGNSTAGDGCSDTCTIEGCGDNVVNNNGVEECDDGNNDRDDGCGPTCLDEFCGDGFIRPSTEECDDGNMTSGDGCDDTCDVENGFDCFEEPSVCSVLFPNIDLIFHGRLPDIDQNKGDILFVSNLDIDNDIRTTSANGDATEEVFFVDRVAKKKNGQGICLGGPLGGAACDKTSDCPAAPPLKFKSCVRVVQVTDTAVGGTPFGRTEIAPNARVSVFTDATSGTSQAKRWVRKDYDRNPTTTTPIDVGEGDAVSPHRSGKLIAVESTADLVGDNADGNSEIFLHDVKKNTWKQITDTVAPVQNRNARITRTKRIIFDSNGDLTNVKRPPFGNPDGNRELFQGRVKRRGANIIEQLTDTVGEDITMGCIARAGKWLFLTTPGDFQSERGTAPNNADGNEEVYRWRTDHTIGGRFLQLTDTTGGENVNVDCAPHGRLIVFESTADIESDGATNRRVFALNTNNDQLINMSPVTVGDSRRPRISRIEVVFESEANLTEENAAGDTVIYLYNTSVEAP